MPPKAIPWRLYTKMAAGFTLLAVGGPLLILSLTPTEEALFLKYNPELQKRSLENRFQKQQDFDEFVGRLKEYSKSDRPIWFEAEKAERERRKQGVEAAERIRVEQEARRREMRESGIKDVPGGSL